MGVVLLLVTVGVACVHGCCTPLQWEMTGGRVFGQPNEEVINLLLTNFTFHYDAESFMIAMLTELFNDPSVRNKTIWNFRDRVMYQIDEIADLCDVTEMTTPFEQICTPEGSRVADHFFYGGGDQSKLPAATFEYDKPEYSGFVSVTEGVEPTDTCVPIVTVDYNLSMMRIMSFENIVDGIKDPSVFFPPPSCASAVKKLDGRAKIHPFLRVPI